MKWMKNSLSCVFFLLMLLTLSLDINAEETQKIAEEKISYQANAETFNKGMTYEGMIHLENPSGHVMGKGLVIRLSLPSNSVDYQSLDLTDQTLNQFFDIQADEKTSTLTFTLKQTINSKAVIDSRFSGNICSGPNQEYDVGIIASKADGTAIKATNQSPKITTATSASSMGFFNAYWGKTESDQGNFYGRSAQDKESIPTGDFTRESNTIHNFLQINVTRGNKTYVDPNWHYAAYWEITTTSNQAKAVIESNMIQVYDETTATVIPPTMYTIQADSSQPDQKVWVIFKSFKEMGISGGDQLRVSLTATVNDDSVCYQTKSGVVFYDGKTAGTSYTFLLNNQFLTKGNNQVFPTLDANDRTFYVGDLSLENSTERLLENVRATDYVDGDVTKKIVIESSPLIGSLQTVGDYPLTYSIENSKKLRTEKTVMIHLIEKPAGGAVTVHYVDEEGNQIAEPEIIHGKMDDPYRTKEKQIAHYTLLTPPKEASGVFKKAPKKITYVYAGNLFFQSAPRLIDFGTHELSAKDEYYHFLSIDEPLMVQDLRKTGLQWQLAATLKTDFVGRHTKRRLPATLYYENETGKVSLALNQKVNLFSKTTTDHQRINLSEQWAEKKQGLAIEVPTGTALKDEYSAVIEWDLTAVVAND